MKKIKPKYFSPTYGNLSFKKVMDHIIDFIEEDISSDYSIIIGTDSNGDIRKKTDYITAIVVHRIGYGGIYFWTKKQEKQTDFYSRIYREAFLSLEEAKIVLENLKSKEIIGYSFEIHVDVGKDGKTKEIINEVVGMIKGSGHKVVTKPESFAASKVADRYT